MDKKISFLLFLLINSFAQNLIAMADPTSIEDKRLRKPPTIPRIPGMLDDEVNFSQTSIVSAGPSFIEEGERRKPTIISQLTEIADSYDAFVIDLHGVVHDGTNLYPGVGTCLQNLRALGKRTIFLSNSARPHDVVRESLLRRGIPPHLYDAVITSGDLAFVDLHARTGPFASLGPHYLYLGKDNDRVLFNPELREAPNIQAADFILGLNIPPDPLETYIPMLQRGIDREIPFICVNPDLGIYTSDGIHQICAGTLAQWYEQQGGKVYYYGKPHLPTYHRVTNFFRNTYPTVSRFLVIGDTLRTDILGANKMSWDSVFIAGGTHQRDLTWEEGPVPTAESLQTLFDTEDIIPTYVLPYLR